MSRGQGKRNGNGINRVTWVGTIALLALMILFLVVTLVSTSRLATQIRVITEHPFTVSTDIGDVRINLALMRVRIERLQSYNQPEDVEFVENSLQEIYSEIEALLEEIDTLYLGPGEDTDALIESYAVIKEAHSEFLSFAKLPSSTTTVIAQYEEDNLYGLYDIFDENAEHIMNYVQSTQQEIFTSAEEQSRYTILWSILIVGATAVGLLFFQLVIRGINQRLYEKNRQFEVLSDTVDETFMIFAKGKKECDFVSGNARRILGISSQELKEDQALIYEHLSAESAKELHKRTEKNRDISWETSVEYRNPKYIQPRWLLLRYYRVGEGSDARYILTFTDRTEERQAQQALQDALDSAQKANSAKKDFLSRMSHEIRTPMNAIIGMTTIAAASIEDRGQVENCLEKISYSSKHLLMLINDVLDMSRIESNRINIHAEPFELYQFLNSFVSVVYPQATGKGLEFQEKITGFTEHTTFLGDSLRLNQILFNLMSNAIKFTPSGGTVRLEVSALPIRNNKCWLRFVVADTGIGMNEEGLKHLYTPFEQADSSIAGKYGGTGLGMSITQNLVALMGGYINVESRPDEGTTFTVELPFESSEIDLQPLNEDALGSLNVLVVDDERDICEHTVLLLDKMKINAQWVLSGTEAVDKVISAQEKGVDIDVCFIDWKMPDMDGIETTRRIRKAVGPYTPIIIISAYDWSAIEREAREAGVNGFIAKPIFQSSIYNALIRVTNGAFGRTDTAVGGRSLEGRRLLLAEDNVLNTEIVATLLKMNGAIVECAEDGRTAVDRFMNTEPGYFDAILMDVQMPVMDGLEATRLIRSGTRKDGKTIPIIATTANAFAEDVAAVMASGMNAHISKPIEMQQLCSLLARFWENGESEG